MTFILPHRLPHRFSRAGVLILAQGFALAVAGSAAADTVVTRFGPIEGVTVTDLKGGRIYYKNAATGREADEDLGRVKSFRVDDVRGLDQGLDAVAAKKDREAIAKFNEGLRQARLAKKPWLVAYLQFQLLNAHRRTGETRLAAQMYLDLVQSKADPVWFQPPIAAAGKPAEVSVVDMVKAADETTRKTVFEQIKQLRNVDPNYQNFVAAMAEATGIKEEVKPEPAVGPEKPAVAGETPKTAPRTGGGDAAPVVAIKGALLLPMRVLSDIRENASNTADIQLALTGRYADALKAMDAALHAKTEMTGVRLFVTGRIYQEMAEQEKDAGKKDALFKDAATYFARIGAQFNEPESSFYAPAMLEFARINLALGNAATAKKALEAAADLANSTTETAYAKRCQDFKTELEK